MSGLRWTKLGARRSNENCELFLLNFFLLLFFTVYTKIGQNYNNNSKKAAVLSETRCSWRTAHPQLGAVQWGALDKKYDYITITISVTV